MKMKINRKMMKMRKILNNKIIRIIKNIISQIMKIKIMKISNKYFKSKGNTENMIFAYQIAKNLKIKEKTIIKSLNEFKGLPHRQEIIFSNKKLLCINDSKATSFDACLQSLLNNNKIYWIVGGLPKYKDYFNLQKVKKKIIKAYIIGKNINFFVKKVRDKYLAVKILYNYAPKL